MDILKNENIKDAAAVLWHKFLLAETVNDIILSEIKDRLYLQNVDEDWLMSPETSPCDTFMARVTDLAFGDVVEEAVTSLYENKEAPPPLLRSHRSKRSRPFIRFDDGDSHGAAHLP